MKLLDRDDKVSTLEGAVKLTYIIQAADCLFEFGTVLLVNVIPRLNDNVVFPLRC